MIMYIFTHIYICIYVYIYIHIHTYSEFQKTLLRLLIDFLRINVTVPVRNDGRNWK